MKMPAPMYSRTPRRWREVPNATHTGGALGVRLSFLCTLHRISNPKGIASSSPRLRGTSHPGKSSRTIPTLKGLRRRLAAPEEGIRAATSFRVDPRCDSQPRVARSSQPWALCRNPFGILHYDKNTPRVRDWFEYSVAGRREPNCHLPTRHQLCREDCSD